MQSKTEAAADTGHLPATAGVTTVISSIKYSVSLPNPRVKPRLRGLAQTGLPRRGRPDGNGGKIGCIAGVVQGRRDEAGRF